MTCQCQGKGTILFEFLLDYSGLDWVHQSLPVENICWNSFDRLDDMDVLPDAEQTVSKHWSKDSFQFNCHFPGGPWLAGTRMSPFWLLL